MLQGGINSRQMTHDTEYPNSIKLTAFSVMPGYHRIFAGEIRTLSQINAHPIVDMVN